VTTTGRFFAKILTLAAVTGVHELSFIGVAFHGKVYVLLENSNDSVNQNHHTFLDFDVALKSKKDNPCDQNIDTVV
jgi:hypothetical protein